MPADAAPRTKPSKRPRYRYVLFRIDRPLGLDRAAVIRALRDVGGADAPWLTRFRDDVGVARCLRGQEIRVRRLLEEDLRRVGVTATPLATSGTLAALERGHPSLPLRRTRPRTRA